MLKDKIAVVTGAGKGIGRGIALVLAREGAAVVVSDIIEDDAIKVAGEIEESGGKALAIPCDVSKKDSVDSLINQSLEKFGSLDILVNNAGVYPFVSFADMTEEDWDTLRH